MKRFLLVAWNVVAAAAFVLSISGWPVNVETWFDWIRGVPSHAWRWILGAGGFAINAASFVYLVVIPRATKARREKRAEERYVDYPGRAVSCLDIRSSGYADLALVSTSLLPNPFLMLLRNRARKGNDLTAATTDVYCMPGFSTMRADYY